jgi:hypothetical protein
MWARTYFSLILSVLLVISIGFIGSTGAQPTLKDPNIESKLVVKDLSSSKRNLVKRVVTMMGAMTTAQAATIVIAYLRSNLDKFSKSKFFLTTRL